MGPSVVRWLAGMLALGALVAGVAYLGPTSERALGFATASGPPRSLVSLQVGPLESGRIIWDAGDVVNERVIPASLGATMFSVPRDASAGPHAVALEDGSGRTVPITFLVAGDELQFGLPRIDHIMSLEPEFSATGMVTTTLYVQGANFDVGSVVKINGMEIATIAHKAITNNLYGVPQNDLGDPIHHYVALAAVPGPRPATSALMVVVRNLDGKESTPVTYDLPASAATLDSDGDSLLDAWETTGHDGNADNVIDTDPYRRDIFVELDMMVGAKPLFPTTATETGTLDGIRAMFAAAPFLNPYTGNGINLVLDLSGTVPDWHTVIFDTTGTAGNQADNVNTVAFSTLKAAHFDRKPEGDMYHYVIWAKRTLAVRSGYSDQPVPTTPAQPGDDALIGLDDFPQQARSQAETLAHELGHNLGLRHGGWTDDRYNPNYLSVMSYAWQLRTGLTRIARRRLVTCLPFYYAKADETELDAILPQSINMVIDYSAGMAKDLDESSVDEVKGVCGQGVDWDGSGRTGDSTDPSNNANDNDFENETIKDFANWPAVQLDGPKQNGRIP